MTQDEVIEIHAIVKGRVQGVGFRATAKRHAQLFGLNGTVCNLGDGSVEIYVLGKRQSVEDFLLSLRENAAFGEVTDIHTKEINPPHTYSGFQILH